MSKTMDLVTQKQIVRQQRAGYAVLHELELEEWRQATFANRLNGFLQILSFNREMNVRPREDDGAIVNERWKKIRKRYAEQR